MRMIILIFSIDSGFLTPAFFFHHLTLAFPVESYNVICYILIMSLYLHLNRNIDNLSARVAKAF